MLVAVLLATGGCAVGGDAPEAQTRPRDLAATPDALPAGTPEHTPAATTSTNEGSMRSSASPTPRTMASATATFRSVGAFTDRAGDIGPTAPRYADLRKVEIASDGRSVRIEVEVAASLPARLRDGEVIGIGVDLFKPAGGEGVYQLFADGGAQGWLAYLHGPKGFVRYPGSFTVAGPRVVFEVPWSSVGNLRKGRIAAFLDWSKRLAVVADASEDYAPDDGAQAYG